MSGLTRSELLEIMSLVRDCDDYLNGRKHSPAVAKLAEAAAARAVLERKTNLFQRLEGAGLRLINEDV